VFLVPPLESLFPPFPCGHGSQPSPASPLAKQSGDRRQIYLSSARVLVTSQTSTRSPSFLASENFFSSPCRQRSYPSTRRSCFPASLFFPPSRTPSLLQGEVVFFFFFFCVVWLGFFFLHVCVFLFPEIPGSRARSDQPPPPAITTLC